MSEEAVRRYITIGFLVAILVTAIGTGVAYARDRALLTGPTESVTGTVIDESKGFLGIRNRLEVSYEVEGRPFRRVIPVKGDGLRGPRIGTYFYREGAAVELLVREDHPGQVRTASRWTPAIYNWLPAFVVAIGTLILVRIVGWLSIRSRRAS